MTPEMRAFEHALGLFSVLIGLAITRRLMAREERVADETAVDRHL